MGFDKPPGQAALLFNTAFSLAADDIRAFAAQFDAAAAFAFFYNQYFLYHNIAYGAVVTAVFYREFKLNHAQVVVKPQGRLCQCALS